MYFPPIWLVKDTNLKSQRSPVLQRPQKRSGTGVLMKHELSPQKSWTSWNFIWDVCVCVFCVSDTITVKNCGQDWNCVCNSVPLQNICNEWSWEMIKNCGFVCMLPNVCMVMRKKLGSRVGRRVKPESMGIDQKTLTWNADVMGIPQDGWGEIVKHLISALERWEDDYSLI